MSPVDKVAILNKAIEEGRRVIRTQLGLAAACVIAGLAAAIAVFVLSGATLDEQFKWILSVASSMLSMGLSAAFPLKEIFVRRQSVNTLSWLKGYYESGRDTGGTSADGERVDKLFWDFVGKSI